MSGGPPPVPGGRTPEEREAARREREARRARSAGAPPAVGGAGSSAGGAGPVVEDREEPPVPVPPAREPATTVAPPAPRRRVRAGRLLAALVALLVLAPAGWFAVSLFQPFKGEGEGKVRVVVPQGAGVGEIADLLAKREVISSPFFFEARATVSGRRGDLKPGAYTLTRDMTFRDALNALAAGPPPNLVTLTVPEGRSRPEIAELVGDRLKGDYLAATRRSPALNPREFDARGASDLEGFLFPATYELRPGRPVSDLVREQLSAFRREFEQVDLRAARKKNLTAYDVLIIASMVEREASLARDRPLIASVIYNRLRDGIPLGIDATLRFALNQWERPLTESELASPSPYNTRRVAGLPPGPIGNPGIASIRAAARPARTDYLYFVVKPGGDGAHAFARTDAEHQRNVERYEQARDALGGRSPD